MSRYVPYFAFREQLAVLTRKESKLPKDVKGPAFTEAVVSSWLRLPGNSTSLGAGILIDEEDYVGDGCRVYFPASADLLRMLWKAKMDVLPSDVARFPNAFSIAMPDDFEVEGMKLPGVLVWFGTEKERQESHRRFGRKYFKDETVVAWAPSKREWLNSERMMGLSYHLKKDGRLASYRCVVPEEALAKCLESPADLVETIGPLDATYTIGLSPEENRQQHALLKTVCRLLVYATACPEAVLSGWPDKYGYQDVGKGYLKKFSPFRMTMPKQDREGPELHWRQWHFRRYPLRDGKRKDGLVFVSGCLVGGEVDPKTVTEVSR